MPLCEPAAEPAVDILRVSHVELGVSDIEASLAFYRDALGMVVSARDADEAVWLRGLEDASHHCLVLRRTQPGTCLGIGLRVRSEADLDRAAAHFAAVGTLEARLDGSERPRGQGPTVLVRDPFGVPLSLYHHQDTVARQL